MRRPLRQLRHELTGRIRHYGSHGFVRLSPKQREVWARRLYSRDGQATSGLLAGWFGRAPLTIAAGPAGGMTVSTAHLALNHGQFADIIRGTLEPSVAEAMLRTVRPGHVVYDVGANLGYWTLVAARLAGPEGRVVAFEPVPWCADAVAANIALNELRQAEVRAQAVSDATGRARLLVVGHADHSLLASVGSHPSTRDEIDVDTVAIDDLVGAGTIPPPDVLKVDTEGAELLVLEGMRETIASHAPRIICEIHDSGAAFAALMEEIGYRTTNLSGPWTIAEAPRHIHVLAEPREWGPGAEPGSVR
ncbi:MAG: FkbM family methyltransferase [Actinomycetota bacterium]|nr:FkbM family methyltransferase [Actinomycetota bacterium]